VLSFSLLEGEYTAFAEGLLGEIVIDVEFAARQASQLGHSLDVEMARLLIHGTLHLIGHDHQRDDEVRKMEAAEARLWPLVVTWRTAHRAALVGGYALATFLAFPHPALGRVVDMGWLASWLAPFLLILALRGLAPFRALILGFLAGLIAHSAVLHWIYVVTVTYGRAPPFIGVIAPILLAGYIASFTALFGAALARLQRRGPASPFAIAALWTVLDHLRSFAFTGFPWATLGYAQHQNLALTPLVAWTGVYGLSFLSVLGAAALAHFFEPAPAVPESPLASGHRGRRWEAWAALGVVVLAHPLGASLGASRAAHDWPTVRVGVLQGNIDQGVKWSPEWAGRTLAIYEELTRKAVAEGAEIVVWPETAAPGSLDSDPALRGRIAALAEATGAALVVGAVGIDGFDPVTGEPARFEEVKIYDSAFLFDAAGRELDRYDKSHLVPFGEYLPFRPLLGRFIRAIATGSAGRDVSSGKSPRSVVFPGVGVKGGEPAVTAGVPICYELLFPDLVRRFVGDGADVLFAITNDAWYGRTGAPYQFLVMTAMRSAEGGVWTARAANTGVSALIDERGRVREQTRIFERGFLVGEVSVRPPGVDDSFYVRHGDWLALVCWGGLLLGWAVAWIRGRADE
jgi:apolipoprotein N-acyltransferase